MAVGGRAGGLGLVSHECCDCARIDDDERTQRPRERLLDVRLVIADQLPDELEAVRRNVGLAPEASIDERYGRDGRADEAALPAVWAEHELLELGPAVRLEQDASSVRMRQRVNGDPFSGLASPTAMQFAPDGRLSVCEQGGRLRVIKDGALLPTPFVTLTVSSAGERGLLGVASIPRSS